MSERNRGIDLFRIVAMLLAVGVHIVGQGGILEATVYSSAAWTASL